MTLVPGAAAPITFFTQVSSLDANATLELEELDALGNVLHLGTFTDSGEYGDARRGDGIFSLQIIVQADQPVIRYFRAKTLENSVAKVSSVMPLWSTDTPNRTRLPNANLTIKDDTIYMGGAFTAINDLGRTHLPGLANQACWTIGLLCSTAGPAKGATRLNSAKLLNNGDLSDWYPGPRFEVHAIQQQNGRVYRGGYGFVEIVQDLTESATLTP